MVIIQYSIVSSDTIIALVPALYFKKKIFLLTHNMK